MKKNKLDDDINGKKTQNSAEYLRRDLLLREEKRRQERKESKLKITSKAKRREDRFPGNVLRLGIPAANFTRKFAYVRGSDYMRVCVCARTREHKKNPSKKALRK